ncbi:MAG: DUF4185 domain-containing protein [Myxococcota bacterium]
MAALGLALGACRGDPASIEPPLPPGECLLLRDNPSGVIGMDVGGSVALGGGRSLFVFGDTFLGGFVDDVARDVARAVHSSVAVVDDAAVASCFAGSAFRAGADGRVAQWLDPTSDRLWPLGPARLADGGSLAFLFTWVRSDPSNGLGFATLGNGIAVAPADAAVVPVDVHALAAPASEAMPAAWHAQGGDAYLYRCGPSLGTGWYPCIVGRAALADAASLEAYRYYVAGQGWVGAYAEATVVTEGAPAFSVTHSAYLGALLEVYVEPFAPFVSVRTAPAPEGPFSAKRDLWPCSLPADDARAYCYAAFEHPQLDSADRRRIVVTYSTNTTDFASMVRHPNVYWPRLATLDLGALRP